MLCICGVCVCVCLYIYIYMFVYVILVYFSIILRRCSYIYISTLHFDT